MLRIKAVGAAGDFQSGNYQINSLLRYGHSSLVVFYKRFGAREHIIAKKV